MPMYQAITIFLLSLALTGIAAGFVTGLRSSLSKPPIWLAMLAAAGVASAASAVVASTRRAGTGFTTSRGWPKPFYFRYLSETGGQSDGWSFIYFLGNSLVFTGAALILFTLWRLDRR